MMDVRYFLCVVAVFGLALAGLPKTVEEIDQQFAKNQKECLDKNNISNSTWQTIKAGHNGKISKEQGCMSACLSKKYEIMDASNTVNIEKVKTMLKEAQQVDKNYSLNIPAFEKCASQQTPNSDACEAGRAFDECLYKLDAKMSLSNK